MSGTYSPIPFPVTRRDSEIRRGSLTLQAAERRGSATPSPIPTTIAPVETRERRDSVRVEIVDDNSSTRRVNSFDQDLQRLKINDSRKRPSSTNFEDSNAAAFSLYITNRVNRVVEDYQRNKQEEQRQRQSQNINQDQQGFPNSPQQLSLRRPLASFTSLSSQRSGSYAQLSNNPYQPGYGPVEQIEWFPRDNAREHRTDRYEIINNVATKRSSPVFRRGQTFFMALKLSSRKVDLAQQPLLVVLNFGSNPTIGKSTKVALTVTGEREFVQLDKSEWDIRLHNQEGNTLTLQFSVPSTALVGVWQYEIHHNNDIFYGREDIYILFNPYCTDDPVYVDNEQFRREYIHSETGKLYRGVAKNQRSYKWVYGQFDASILPLTVLLLDRFTEGNRNIIDYSQRGSPVFVVRALANLMYSRNAGPLREASLTAPETTAFDSYSYTGSQSILDRLIENRFQPITTDNQSYIASALFVTFCRALGIPARSITTYRAPIDKTTLSVDQYWGGVEEDATGNDLYEAYQCINDVFFRRDDLVAATSYVGWQAVDPNSSGRGPAPAEAIRRGEIGLNYDIFYFYSLFNSQFRHFYSNTYPETVVSDDIGRLIITKKCDRDEDDDDHEDVTHLYKKKDGSDDEKLAVVSAIKGLGSRRGSSLRQQDLLATRNDDLIVDWLSNTASYGQNLQVSLSLQNVASELRTLVVNFFARPVYRGVVGRKIKHFKRQLTLQPLQRESLALDLHLQEYQDRLDDDYLIRFYASIFVKETNQFWAGDDDVTLSTPKINIQTRTVAQVDNECHVNFSMVNPLSVSLTDCYLFYESGGITNPVYRKIKDIKPGEMLNVNEQLTPRKSGDSRLVAVFNSRQLRNVQGSKIITVRE
ncbi:unnamed protein product [Allacma fusca]|uniref:Transglutaminase-like domain-containing protein n=1 Tax=Allacma fusca TaxID=39272 RepID=A0A8J2LPG9_9HEXA|nr:unnamed protein product [Allacma fusca]